MTHKKLRFLLCILFFSFGAQFFSFEAFNLRAEESRGQITNYHQNLGRQNLGVYSDDSQNLVQIWNDSEGLKRLTNSAYNNDFYQMVNFYQPQINPLYCGIASSVIILNSLRSKTDKMLDQKDLEVIKPQSLGGGVMHFKSYSQLTFLNSKTDQIKNRKIIELQNLAEIASDKNNAGPGLSLNDLAKILKKVYKLQVKVTHADNAKDNDIKKFREVLKKVLTDKKSYLVVNFDTRVLGFKSGGHFSPIAAYDEASDLVLVMDVATHDRPWYWVLVSSLYEAMNTKDGNQYRGYLVVAD